MNLSQKSTFSSIEEELRSCILRLTLLDTQIKVKLSTVANASGDQVERDYSWRLMMVTKQHESSAEEGTIIL